MIHSATATDHPRHKLLNVEQAAAVVGVRSETLLSWVIKGQGPKPYLFDPATAYARWTTAGLRGWRGRQEKPAQS